MSVRKEGNINPKADQRIIRREIEKEMHRLGQLAERYILDYFQKHNIDDTGTLAKSVYSEVQTELNRMTLQFGANAKHAIFVHDGTKPHWAPIDQLEKWVVRKLNKTFPEAGQIAQKIQFKIAKSGTKGKPFAAVSMRLLRKTAPLKIESAINRGIRLAS